MFRRQILNTFYARHVNGETRALSGRTFGHNRALVQFDVGLDRGQTDTRALVANVSLVKAVEYLTDFSGAMP